MTREGFNRIVARLGMAAEWLTTALFFAIFVISLMGIAARYLFSAPIVWSDELAMMMFLWCIFLTDALVSRDRDQVAFDILWSSVSPASRRVIGLVQTAMFAVLFAVAFPTVLDYVLFLWRERTPALEWRLDLVYLCFVIYLAMVIVRLVAKFAAFAGPDWRDHVSDDAPSTSNVIG